MRVTEMFRMFVQLLEPDDATEAPVIDTYVEFETFSDYLQAAFQARSPKVYIDLQDTDEFIAAFQHTDDPVMRVFVDALTSLKALRDPSVDTSVLREMMRHVKVTKVVRSPEGGNDE